MISAGYEDEIDANCLRGRDPMFKMALDLTPSDRELCSQSTISRLENLPDVRALLRMGRAMVDLYCSSFPTVPKRITLDVDDTFDAVHGGQQLRLFNAHYDEYGFQPIVVFDGEGRSSPRCFVPPNDPAVKEIRAFSPPAVARDPGSSAPHRDPASRRQPLLRPRGSRLASRQQPRLHPRRRDDHDVASSCCRSRSQHEGAVRGCVARRQAPPLQGVLRRREQLEPGRAHHRPRRSQRGRATTPASSSPISRIRGTARRLYEDVYCRRGRAENHIKSWKTHLAADRHLLHQGDRQINPASSSTPAPTG